MCRQGQGQGQARARPAAAADLAGKRSPMATAGYVPVSSEAELRDLLGEPSARAASKERPRLHQRDREWLAASPFCLIAT